MLYTFNPEKLERARHEKGFTRQQLAGYSHVSLSTVIKATQGKAIRECCAYRIAAALMTTAPDLT